MGIIRSDTCRIIRLGYILFWLTGFAITGYPQPGTPSPDPQIDRIFQTYQDRQYTESLHLIEQLLKDNPNHPQSPIIQTILANVYFQLGKYQPACQTLENFIRHYPEHPNLGNAYFLLGHIEGIRFHYLPAAEYYLKAYHAGQADPNLIIRIDQSLNELIKEKLEINELIQFVANPDADSFRNSINYSIADHYYQNFDCPKAIEYWNKIDSSIDSFEIRTRLAECRNSMMATQRIGLIGPLSGEYSSYGNAMIRGVSMAIDYFHRSGSDPIRIIPYDNRNEPIQTAKLIRQMIRDDSVDAIIGPIRSMNAIAAGIVATEYRIPLIAPMIMIDDFNQLGTNLFQLSTPPAIQGELIAAYAIKQLGLKYFAVIAPNSTYGHSISQSFTEMIRQFSAHLIDTLWYDPADTDFNPMIEQLRNQILNTPEYQHLIQPVSTIKGEDKQIIRIDGVFIPAEKVQDIITILPQLNYNLISCRFIGNSSWLDDQLFHLSSHLLDSAIIASDDRLSGSDSLTQQFEIDYQSKYHQLPDRIARKSYDAAFLMLQALTPSPDSSCDISQSLSRIEDYQGVSGRINLRKNMGVNSQLYFFQVKNRRFIELP